MVNRIIVTRNAGNFREILTLFLLLGSWSVFIVLKSDTKCSYATFSSTDKLVLLTSVRILTASDSARNAQKVKSFKDIFLAIFLSLKIESASLNDRAVTETNKGCFMFKGKKWEMKTRAFTSTQDY